MVLDILILKVPMCIIIIRNSISDSLAMRCILFYMAVLIVPMMGDEVISDCKFPSEKFIVDSFHKYAVTPQIVPNAPTKYFSAKLEHRKDAVNYGNSLLGFNYPNEPFPYFEGDPSLLYTAMYVSPDMYYVEHGSAKYSYLFRLSVNIPGGNFAAGDSLGAFLPFVPPTGYPGCRIIGLIYEQTSRINITVDLMLSVMSNVRKFDFEGFVTENDLGDPVSGNFNIAIAPFCESMLEDVC